MSASPQGANLNTKLVRTVALTLSLACMAIVLVVGLRSAYNTKEQLERTEALLAETLDQKGTLLTENHGLALRAMVADNAFGEVDDLVRKAVEEDDQIVYGLFLDSNERAWSLHGPGLEEAEEWTKLGIDPEETGPSRRKLWKFGVRVWEYTAPVAIDDEVVGTLHYGLSTARLDDALKAEQASSIDLIRHTLSQIVMVGVTAAFAGIFVIWRRSQAITGPLEVLTDAAHRIAQGEKDVRAEVQSGDELEVLADSFNEMVADLEKSYHQLQVFSEGLEHAVEERTEELRVKTNDVRRMLDNIAQGVFTLLPDLRLHDEYSANLETILDRDRLGGRSFDELFVRPSDLGTAARSATHFVLGESFGAMGFFFGCNQHLLPTEFSIRTPSGGNKLIEVEYVGIEDEDENLERVLVIVRDVTELRALREEAEAQREALQVVGELLAVPQAEVERFFERSFATLDDNRALIEATPDNDPATLETLFRNTHTLKGNARLLGFQRLNDVVHDAEDLYRKLRRGEAEWVPDTLVENGELVRTALRHYSDVFEEKLASRGGAEEVIPASVVAAALASARSHDQLVARLNTHVAEATTKPLPEAMGGAVRQLTSLAKQLGKEPPEVVFDGDEPRVDSNLGAVLQDVFVHVLRNGIDHGIETSEERIAAGKTAQGTIRIQVRDADGELTFRVRDDGRGLSLHSLREKLGKPDASGQELANAVFDSGVSTARSVTSVSGRGVGMDAVRQFLVDRGGSARIEVDEVPSSASHAPFTLVLVCPREAHAELATC